MPMEHYLEYVIDVGRAIFTVSETIASSGFPGLFEQSELSPRKQSLLWVLTAVVK